MRGDPVLPVGPPGALGFGGAFEPGFGVFWGFGVAPVAVFFFIGMVDDAGYVAAGG